MEAVAGLDIGSSHIVAAVAVPAGHVEREWKSTREPKDAGHPSAGPVPGVLKIGSSGTLGMRRGQVTDPAALSRSIGEAVAGAEAAAGAGVGAVCIGLPGHTVQFCRKKYGNLIGKRRINQQDIDRVNRLAVVSHLPPGRAVIGALPLEYVVDGAPVAGKPLGMHCSRLEVELMVVTAERTLVDQLVDAVRGSSIKARIADFLPSTLAAGRALLSGAQQRLGTALVDMGGSCTCVLVYNHGCPVGFEVLPVGSDHITSDLAVCLRTTLEGAEEVKRGLGLVAKGNRGAGDDTGGPRTLTVPRLSGAGFNEVPLKNAVEIIEARICEILEMVGSSVSRLAGGIDLPGGLVLAGGGSRLAGLDLFASDYLGLKVSAGSLGVGEEDSRLPVNTAGAVGLLKHMQDCSRPAEDDHRPTSGLWNTVRRIFKVSR